MKTIADPVHGNIAVSEDDLKIIDTPVFQRLRGIKVMSTAFYTYPSAHNTRFEHCLGVMTLATAAFKSAVESEYNANGKRFSPTEIDDALRYLRIAALLHDVGHPPFSHIGEEFYIKDDLVRALEERNYKDPNLPNLHKGELMSALVVDTHYGDIIRSLGMSVHDVVAIILGFQKGEQIDDDLLRFSNNVIDSPIDVDKLDYVVRDSLLSGSSLTAGNVNKLISSYCIAEYNKLAANGKAFSALLSLIHSRESLYRWVYQHHTVCYSDTVIARLIDTLPEETRREIFSLTGITKELADDGLLVSRIRKVAEDGKKLTQMLYRRIQSRSFLKPIWKNETELNQMLGAGVENFKGKIITDKSLRSLEEQIRTDLHLPEDGILICKKAFSPFDYRAENIRVVKKPGSASIAITDYFEYLKHPRVPEDSLFVYSEKEHHEPIVAMLKA